MSTNSTWFERNAMGLKVLLCGFLLAILMIPTLMLSNTIYERSQRAVEARQEIMSKWGGNQTLTGPIISVPYIVRVDSTDETHYYHFLPTKLAIESTLVPEVRTRGIYSTIVYTSDDSVTANFQPLRDTVPASFAARDRLQWNRAVVSYGISDMKGVEKTPEATFNSAPLALQPGLITADVLSSGVSREIAVNPGAPITFTLGASLRGGEQIQFLPVGKETTVKVSGAWPSPSFNGAFLPSSRSLKDGAFTATWQVTDFNRNFPQHWEGTSYQLQYIPQSETYAYDDMYFSKPEMSYASPGGAGLNIGESAFGVKLIEVVDHYDKVTRSIKYAFLIIGLSFLSFFLMEVVRRKPIHVLQYLLIGFALVVFYTLLLSISEHIPFNGAYIISGLATIGLIAGYTKAICHDWKYAQITGGILAVLYTLVFVILQSEDYALLIGSISVFIILGILMYTTRRIDWYQVRK